jgi:hypothetical protein
VAHAATAIHRIEPFRIGQFLSKAGSPRALLARVGRPDVV